MSTLTMFIQHRTGSPRQWNKTRKGNKMYTVLEKRNKTFYRCYGCLCRKFQRSDQKTQTKQKNNKNK